MSVALPKPAPSSKASIAQNDVQSQQAPARATLYDQLQKLVLSRVMVVVFAFTLAICALFLWVGESQLEERHSLEIARFTDALELSIDNVRTNIVTLAANDLLINAMIDFEMRDEYLPLFFQSLRIAKGENNFSALYDFSGELVQDNNWPIAQVDAMAPDWKKTVLNQGEVLEIISPQGLLIITPIFISGQPEGALAGFTENISALMQVDPKQTAQVLFDSNQQAVATTDATYLDLNMDEFLELSRNSFVMQTPYKNFNVLSTQSFSSAYAASIWLLPIFLMAILGTLFSSWYAVRLASEKSAETLQRLHKSLAQQLLDEDMELITHGQDTSNDIDEALELYNIRASFHTLTTEVLALSISNNKITNVINSLSEFLIVVDNEGHLILENATMKAASAALGIEHNEIISQAIDLLQTDTSPSFSTKHIRLNEQNTKAVDEQAQNNRVEAESEKSKALCIIDWRVTRFVNKAGETIGAIVTGQDVSERVALEQNIKMRNKALEASPVAVSIADVSKPWQPLIYVNHAFSTMTGFSFEEAIGQNCKFLQGEQTQAASIAAIRQAITKNEPLDIEINNYRKNGDLFVNSLSIMPVFNDDGSVQYYVAVQQDITLEKQTALLLSQAKDKAEQTMESQATFFASINHELRTPINGINGMLKALMKTELTEKQVKYATLANKSADNLLLIVNDVLDYSKAESGQLSIEQHPCDVHNLLNDICQRVEAQCHSKSLSFSRCIDELKGHTFLIDAMRVQQVIENLINNALKFTDTGAISLAVKLHHEQPEGEYSLHFCIKDSGIGIDHNHLVDIFKSFKQVKQASNKVTTGTGLGLTISKQLVELMGGKIKATSTVNEGSCFHFSVRTQITEAPISKCSVDVPDLTAGKIPNVLIVEDNEINQEVLIATLTDTKTIVAHNGIQALEILQKIKVPIDVILMDCQMPELDGWQTTRMIRDGEAGEKHTDAPIIAITAFTTSSDKQKCHDAGMDDYLSKPFQPQSLQEKVLSWSNKRH